jgi:hypothetical protein
MNGVGVQRYVRQFALMLALVAATGLSSLLTTDAIAHNYPERCTKQNPERFKRSTLAVRPLKHLTSGLVAEDGGVRVVQISFVARAMICRYHAYLTADVKADTSALHDDEALLTSARWVDQNGKEHFTHHSSSFFPQHDGGAWPPYFTDNTAFFELGPHEYFPRFKLYVGLIKKNDSGLAVGFSRTIVCSMGTLRDGGDCNADRSIENVDDESSHGDPSPAATPDTRITAGPPSTTTSDSAEVHFTSPTPGAGFECRFDTNAWVACVDPKAYSQVGLGRHTVLVRATVAGIVDPSPASIAWTRVPPATTIAAAPAGSVTRHHAEIFFSANETAHTSFECNLDGAGWVACANPKSYSQLALGNHTFQVRAVTLAAPDPTPATATWTVIRPETTITAGPHNSTSTTANVYFNSPNDPEATFQCRFDGAEWVPCTNPKAYSGIAKGSHTVYVRAVDLGAEDQSPATWSWTRTG